MNEPNIEQYYQMLNLEPGASVEDIKQAYLKFKHIFYAEMNYYV